jgi:hypothetical protein
VVDHSALQIDELTYLLSEHAGDTEVEAYVDKLVSVWTKIRAINAITRGYGALPSTRPFYLQGNPTPSPKAERAPAQISDS